LGVALKAGEARMVITIGNLLPLDVELKERFQQLFKAVKRFAE
jgi:hypothetical protein